MKSTYLIILVTIAILAIHIHAAPTPAAEGDTDVLPDEGGTSEPPPRGWWHHVVGDNVKSTWDSLTGKVRSGWDYTTALLFEGVKCFFGCSDQGVKTPEDTVSQLAGGSEDAVDSPVDQQTHTVDSPVVKMVDESTVTEEKALIEEPLQDSMNPNLHTPSDGSGNDSDGSVNDCGGLGSGHPKSERLSHSDISHLQGGPDDLNDSNPLPVIDHENFAQDTQHFMNDQSKEQLRETAQPGLESSSGSSSGSMVPQGSSGGANPAYHTFHLLND